MPDDGSLLTPLRRSSEYVTSLPARRRRYAQMFLEVGCVQAIAEDAGVDRTLVDWTGSPAAIWSSLFEVARNNDQVPALVGAAERAARVELDRSRGGGAASLLDRENLAFTGALAFLALVVVVAYLACILREALGPREAAAVAIVYLALSAAAVIATWYAFSASGDRASLALALMRLLKSRSLRVVALVAHAALALALGGFASQQVRVRFDCAVPREGVRCGALGAVCGDTRWLRPGTRLSCEADDYFPSLVTAGAGSAPLELRLAPRMLWQCRVKATSERRPGGPPGVGGETRFLGYWQWTLSIAGPADSPATLGVALLPPASGGARVASGRFEVPSRPPSVRRQCRSEEGTVLELPLGSACRGAEERTLSLSVYDADAAPPLTAPPLAQVAVLKVSGDPHASGPIECR